MINIFLPIEFKKWDALHALIGQCKMMKIDDLLRIWEVLHQEDLQIRRQLT